MTNEEEKAMRMNQYRHFKTVEEFEDFAWGEWHRLRSVLLKPKEELSNCGKRYLMAQLNMVEYFLGADSSCEQWPYEKIAKSIRCVKGRKVY